ncbi:hypothetical protein [Actinomadura macrotermitis]|uniref:DUF8094 domain-containing protein n=1 Tax=Actinomadura macrotermitis TaxID=2585200 RepID=A0A7K0C0U5_9ACTN|nr:hypothetical protein [Actinomadura macrotermitis]MQY07067.1 hypothetical protein [Actinomadura macrotermitis]
MRGYLALVVAACTLTSCSDDPDPADTAGAARPAAPAVSAEESARVLKDWVARHNKALTSGEERDWRAAVTGALAAPVRARVRTYGALGAEARISLRNPVFYVPRLSGGPRWFAVAALERSDGRERQVLALFTRNSAKEPWLAAHWLTFKGRPPELAYDPQGYAVPASDRGLPAAHAAYLTSNDQTGLAPDAFSTQARSGRSGDWTAPPGRFTPGPGPSHALRTRDGGSLVWYGLTQRQTLTGGTAERLPGELRAYLTKTGADPGGTVRATWQWLAIGYSPATGGKARVLGTSVSLTEG